MHNPLKFFSDVIDRVTLMTDAIELYSYRTGDFGLVIDGKKIYMEDGDELMDVIDVKYKLISKLELVKRLVAVEAMEAKSGIDAIIENSSSKEAAHFFLNQQMNKLEYLLRAYNSSYKENKDFTPLKIAMQEIWQSILDKYPSLIERQYKSIKKIHATNSSIKVIWTGTTALLGTLLHELRTQRVSQSEPPLIANDWKELATWVRDNFVDKNGNEITLSTIMTNLDPNPKKRKSKKHKVMITKN